MGASVTVLGASGTITVPFKSQANALLAQQLANYISSAIQGGSLYNAPYNSTTLTALPSVPGGTAFGEQVIGDNSAVSVSGGNIQNPAGYPVIIDNASNPVTVTGAPIQVGPYGIEAGEGGLTFHGENSSLGGSIYLGGGNNVLDGVASGNSNPDWTNGGLIGNWIIGTGDDGTNSTTTSIRLALGNDQINVGGNDSIATGGANAQIDVTSTPGAKATVWLGMGNVTFYGGSESGDIVLGQGIPTGDDLIIGGTGGNSTLAAGSGNATLIGGGNNDIIFGSQSSTNQQLWASGNTTLFGGGSSSDTFFGGSYLGSGNVLMSAAGSSGNNQFWAGSGNDSIWTGLGNDSVFVFADHTAHSGTAPSDVVENYAPNDTVYLSDYASWNFTNSGAGTVLNLSDGTQVTFAGITDPNTIKVVG